MAALFTDTTPDAGTWCSRGDCNDVLRVNIATYCDDEVDRLDREIERATGYAMSILRSRWPDGDWPFSGTPAELRRAVAVIAAFGVFFGRTLPDELEFMIAERDWAEEYLRGIRDGDVVLEQTAEESTAERIALSSRPDWAATTFGFRHAAD